jgi:hypothetical protein
MLPCSWWKGTGFSEDFIQLDEQRYQRGSPYYIVLQGFFNGDWPDPLWWMWVPMSGLWYYTNRLV